MNNRVVGLIGYGPPSENIRTYSPRDVTGVAEIQSVYILPEYQRLGIGTILWNAIVLSLWQHGISEACLDSSFARAQAYWRAKIGEPTVTAEKHGHTYMIWYRATRDLVVRYSLPE